MIMYPTEMHAMVIPVIKDWGYEKPSTILSRLAIKKGVKIQMYF